MSLEYRDYMREGGPTGRPGGPSTWSVVTWLIVINTAIFLVHHLFFYRTVPAPDGGSVARSQLDFLTLSIEGLRSFQVWSPLTYQFIHASFLHLLGNMLMLYFLGNLLLSGVGPRHFLKVYLLGGLAGGAVQLIFNLAVGVDGYIQGASGAVFAVVVGAATLTPNMPLQLLFIPIRLTLKHVVIVLIAVDALSLLGGRILPNQSGEQTAVFAHAGGMLLGWLYIRFWFTRTSPSRGRARPSRPKKRGFFGIRILRDGEESDPGEPTGKGSSPAAKSKPFVTDDVDAILDKINEHGFQSLTDEERRILEKSSKKLSKRIDRGS